MAGHHIRGEKTGLRLLETYYNEVHRSGQEKNGFHSLTDSDDLEFEISIR
jgi:hypothetical protein